MKSRRTTDWSLRHGLFPLRYLHFPSVADKKTVSWHFERRDSARWNSRMGGAPDFFSKQVYHRQYSIGDEVLILTPTLNLEKISAM